MCLALGAFYRYLTYTDSGLTLFLGHRIYLRDSKSFIYIEICFTTQTCSILANSDFTLACFIVQNVL